MHTEGNELTVTILLASSLLLQLVGLFIAVSMDRYLKKTDRAVMQLIVVLVLALIISSFADAILSEKPQYDKVRLFLSVFGYCARPVVLLLFGIIVKLEKDWTLVWTLVTVNTLTYLTAFFSDVAFYIRDGNFGRGPLGFMCHIVSFILTIWYTYKALKRFRSEARAEWIFPLAVALLVIVSAIVDTEFEISTPVTCLSITMTTGCVFFYIWLHLQFVREHEKMVDNEWRVQMMMTQIQPHFLFNTLSTIQALCRIDPEKAFSTLGVFGEYLRENLGVMQSPDLIPFEDELRHTKLYAEIEQIRFPNITVEYRVLDSAFKVPVLCLQPLVENAVKHGVRTKKNGKIIVSAYREGDSYVYSVADNGKGFTSESMGDPDRTHIGMQNVQERIERQCGGTVTVRSTPGEGTEITVKIPAAEGDSDENNVR